MSRGTTTPATVAQANAWTTLYDATTDGKVRSFNAEADGANTDRVVVRWTSNYHNINFVTLAPGTSKPFAAPEGVILVEAQSASAGQKLSLDVLACS